MKPDKCTVGGKLDWENVATASSLDDLAISFGLDSALLTQRAGVVIVPNNKRLPNQTRNCNIFPQATPAVRAALREGGLDVSIYDDGREKRELVLKSSDVILPTLLFFGSAAVSIGCGILSNLIYELWIKRNPNEARSVRAEYLELDDNRVVVRWRKVEGSAEEVRQLFAEEARPSPEAWPNPHVQSPMIGQPAPTDAMTPAQGQDALSAAAKLIERAEVFLRKKRRTTAEKLFRESLTNLREATLWEPDEPAHREHLHRTGLRIHDLYGCQIPFKDGGYVVSCPVMLSHFKGGFSIGGTATVICSICGANVLECPHVPGRQYNGVTAARIRGVCNICAERKCSHVEGKSYDGVERFGLLSDIDLDHISLVERPAMPLCTVYSYNLTKADVLNMLPLRERAGFLFGKTPLPCHHCTICKGK